MRDLIVSAGKKRKLYDIPAAAPASACCHSGRGASSSVCVVGRLEGLWAERATSGEFSFRNKRVTVSFEPNHAALPPDSLISVPSWPCQNPRNPWWWKTSRITASGLGARRTIPSVDVATGTWILHLTSSTGVRTRLVKAPAIAPVSQNAESGRGFSRSYRPAAKRDSRPTRSQKNKDEFSRAAPNRGALMPR